MQGGVSLGGRDDAGVLGRRRSNHLDQHPSLGRQRGGHRAGVPLAAAAAAVLGHSAWCWRCRCCCASSSPSSSPRSWASPFLKLVGGLLLLWIAVKLIVPSDEHGEDSVKAGDTLLRAVWLVTVADIVMSLDNVIAIAAAAETAAARVDLAHALEHQDHSDRLRPCDLGAADHRRQHAADGAAQPLPDPGLGGRGPARLGRRRDHGEGRSRGRLDGSGVRRQVAPLGRSRRRGVRDRARLDHPQDEAQEGAGAAADRRSAGTGGVSAEAG